MSGRNEFLAQYGSHEHIEKIMDGDDDELKLHALNYHHALSDDNLHHAQESKNSDVRNAVLKVPYAKPEHLAAGINSVHWNPRSIAAQHPNLSDEQHKRVLNDRDSIVREEALRNPKTTDEQLKHALNDPDVYVKHYANKKLKTREGDDDLLKALNN